MKKLLFALYAFFCMSFAMAVVNINTASVQELQSLPNIGSVKAQAIEDYRKANGPFKTTEDITKVKGIGKATFERLKDEITVGGGAKAPAAPAKKDAKAKPATK